MDDKGGPLVFQEKQHTLSALGRARISSWKRSETSMWDVSHDGSSNGSREKGERENWFSAAAATLLCVCAVLQPSAASGNS
jgi:hypothetical protein